MAGMIFLYYLYTPDLVFFTAVFYKNASEMGNNKEEKSKTPKMHYM